MDDQSTIEALRKLDGLSGKAARARSSIGGHSRVGSSSRPSTPAKTTTQWEGIEGGSRSSKRTSMHASLGGKEKAKEGAHRVTSGLALSSTEGSADTDYVVTSGDDAHHGSPGPDKSTKKTGSASARSSFTPKRGSASSGTYASTPTSGSRDSASCSLTRALAFFAAQLLSVVPAHSFIGRRSRSSLLRALECRHLRALGCRHNARLSFKPRVTM